MVRKTHAGFPLVPFTKKTGCHLTIFHKMSAVQGFNLRFEEPLSQNFFPVHVRGQFLCLRPSESVRRGCQNEGLAQLNTVPVVAVIHIWERLDQSDRGMEIAGHS